MLLRISRFSFLQMSDSHIQIIYKILNAIDSDDIQVLALSIEANLPKEETAKLKKMLKMFLQKNKLNNDEANLIKQFHRFLQ